MSFDCLQNAASVFYKQSKDIQNVELKTNASNQDTKVSKQPGH